MLIKLYARFGIDDNTDYSQLSPTDYPTMADLYELTEREFKSYEKEKRNLYTEETLQNICLGIYSMCRGAEARYFCGHSNIKDGEFICFGVKGLMDTNKRLKDALLFNILSFISNQLLCKGNTVAAIDELYLFLTNMTAIDLQEQTVKAQLIYMSCFNENRLSDFTAYAERFTQDDEQLIQSLNYDYDLKNIC